jgi:cyanate permease
VVFFLFRARDAVAGVSAPLVGLDVRQALAGSRFWRLAAAFFLISIVVGGMIVSLPAMLADRGIALGPASQALGLMGGSIIVGRLAIGFLVDRMPARAVAPVFILLPVVSTLMLAQGLAPVPAVVLLGLAAGAEVDLLAYLISRYFGMLHYAKIYGWGLSAFSAGAGTGPIFAGWVHDGTGSYVLALYAFACSVTVAAVLIGTLGRPDPAFGGGR